MKNTYSIDYDFSIISDVVKNDFCFEDCLLLLTPRHAVEVINQLENRIRIHENLFGKQALINIATAVPTDSVVSHVEYYRHLIRNNSWPNTSRPSTLASFIRDYYRSALAYIDVGFEALRFIAGQSTQSLEEIYYKVQASEGLRGQFGKRSPTGLDARLEHAENELVSLLQPVFGSDTDNVISTLCTPTYPYLSCESSLLQDFAKVYEIFSDPPTVDQIFSTDKESQQCIWTFLQKYSKWNIDLLSELYTRLKTRGLGEELSEQSQYWEKSRLEQIKFAERIFNLGDESNKQAMFALIASIIELNYLNLALEPSYSFKSGIGLFHGLIFRKAESEIDLPFMPELIDQQKWWLFSQTQFPTLQQEKDKFS